MPIKLSWLFQFDSLDLYLCIDCILLFMFVSKCFVLYFQFKVSERIVKSFKQLNKLEWLKYLYNRTEKLYCNFALGLRLLRDIYDSFINWELVSFFFVHGKHCKEERIIEIIRLVLHFVTTMHNERQLCTQWYPVVNFISLGE